MDSCTGQSTGFRVKCPSHRAVTPNLSTEIARRRTFAIISHPDAGKIFFNENVII